MDYYLQLPSEIEGEPEQVVEQIERDLSHAAAVLGHYVADAFVQLRAAGLSTHETIEDWEGSAEGERAVEVRMRTTALLAAIRRLTA